MLTLGLKMKPSLSAMGWFGLYSPSRGHRSRRCLHVHPHRGPLVGHGLIQLGGKDWPPGVVSFSTLELTLSALAMLLATVLRRTDCALMAEPAMSKTLNKLILALLSVP